MIAAIKSMMVNGFSPPSPAHPTPEQQAGKEVGLVNGGSLTHLSTALCYLHIIRAALLVAVQSVCRQSSVSLNQCFPSGASREHCSGSIK